MVRFFLLIVLVVAALFLWKSPAGRQYFGSLLHGTTASGTLTNVRQSVQNAVDLGKEGVRQVQEQVGNVQGRVDQVREGIRMLGSGGKLIEQGMKQVTGK